MDDRMAMHRNIMFMQLVKGAHLRLRNTQSWIL